MVTIVGLHKDRLRPGLVLPASRELVMDDRLKKPSRQSRALWVLVEGVVRRPKMFVLFQQQQFHHSLRNPSRFEVYFPILLAECMFFGEHNDHAMGGGGADPTALTKLSSMVIISE